MGLFEYRCTCFIIDWLIWLLMGLFEYRCTYFIIDWPIWLFKGLFEYRCTYFIIDWLIWLLMGLFEYRCTYFSIDWLIWLIMGLFDYRGACLIIDGVQLHVNLLFQALLIFIIFWKLAILTEKCMQMFILLLGDQSCEVQLGNEPGLGQGQSI